MFAEIMASRCAQNQASSMKLFVRAPAPASATEAAAADTAAAAGDQAMLSQFSRGDDDLLRIRLELRPQAAMQQLAMDIGLQPAAPAVRQDSASALPLTAASAAPLLQPASGARPLLPPPSSTASIGGHLRHGSPLPNAGTTADKRCQESDACQRAAAAVAQQQFPLAVSQRQLASSRPVPERPPLPGVARQTSSSQAFDGSGQQHTAAAAEVAPQLQGRQAMVEMPAANQLAAGSSLAEQGAQQQAQHIAPLSQVEAERLMRAAALLSDRRRVGVRAAAASTPQVQTTSLATFCVNLHVGNCWLLANYCILS